MFEWLVHSKTRLRMMKLFFKDPKSPLYGLEIAQALKASPGTTHRELNAMLKQGIITKKKEGALVMYRLNTDHPYFRELRKAVFPKKKKTQRVLFVSDLHLSVETSNDVIDDLHLFLDYAEENATELVLVGDMIEMLEANVFQTYLYHKPLFDRLSTLSHDLKITYLVGNHDCFLQLLTTEGEKFFGSQVTFAQQYYEPKMGIYATHGHLYDDYEEMKGFKPSGKAPQMITQLAQMMKALSGERDGYTMHQSKLLETSELAQKAWKFAQYVRTNKIDYSAKFQKLAKQLIQDEDYAYVVFGHTHKAQLKQISGGIAFNTGSWKKGKKRHFVEIDREGGALVSLDELR